MTASYYERWLTGLATRLVERGVLTREELERRTGAPFPLVRPAAPPEPISPAVAGSEPRFAIGDTVRVRNLHPRGHTRCPRYVRSKLGTIVRVDGAFALPDVAARDRAGERRNEWAYGVRFAARELWGESASPNDTIHVDLWESYLEPA